MQGSRQMGGVCQCSTLHSLSVLAAPGQPRTTLQLCSLLHSLTRLLPWKGKKIPKPLLEQLRKLCNEGQEKLLTLRKGFSMQSSQLKNLDFFLKKPEGLEPNQQNMHCRMHLESAFTASVDGWAPSVVLRKGLACFSNVSHLTQTCQDCGGICNWRKVSHRPSKMHEDH